MRNMLIEISAVDPKTKDIEVIRMAAAHATAEGVYVDGKEWLPAITGDNEVSLTFWGEGRRQPLTVSYGSIDFLISPRLGNHLWPMLDFDGASATLWVGPMGAPFTAYEQVWTGSLGPLIQDATRNGKLALLGAEAQLNRPLLDRTYQGTGGAEGYSGTLGKLKPFGLGECVNVAPFLLDPVRFVYQVNAYAPTSINAVYSSALTLAAPVADVATFADLVALDLEPGEWAACSAVGMFRLGGDPNGAKITADIGAASDTRSIARALALKSGILESRLGASFTGLGRGYSLHATDETHKGATIAEELRKAAFGDGRFLLTDALGKLHLAPYASTKAPGTLASDGSALPLVRSDTIVQEAPASPAWQVKVGHSPVWSVHTGNGDISEAVALAGADLSAAQKAAEAAQERADEANATAKLAIQRLDDTVADGILDRAEKRQWIAAFEAATGERAELVSEGTAQGATAQVNAYSAAYTALSTYLAGLSPAFDDLSQNTPIDPDFRSRFVAYEIAQQNLVNALANKAAKTAQWLNVAERPTDLTSLNEADGTKLSGIEFGATRNQLRGNWQNGVVYYVGDIVFYAGTSYGVATAHTATNPPPGNNYMTFASQGTTGDKGDAGPQGGSLYTWIAYAYSANGSDRFTTGANTGHTYIGIANNKVSSEESQTPSDYTWSLIKGSDGVPGDKGANGETTYTWFAYSGASDGSIEFTTGNPTAIHTYIGIAANKLTATESQTASDYTWSKLTGDKGGKGDSGDKGDKGDKGDAALVAYLTNETVNVPCDYLGNPISYASGVGQMRVFLGSTEVTGSCSFLETGNAGVSVAPGFTGASSGFYAIDGLATDTGTVTLRATYGTVSIDKTFTATKSYAGAPGANGSAGAAAKDVAIIASSLVLRLDKDGALVAGHPSFSFRVEKKNTSATHSFGYQPVGHGMENTSIVDGVFTVTAQRVLDMISYNLGNGYGSQVTVRVTCDGLTDDATIVAVKDGATGAKGDKGDKGDNALVAYLTNESVNVPCDSAGTPLSYASGTGQMRVFLGTTEVTASCSFVELLNDNASVAPSFNGASSGYYALDALAADTGTATLRATYSGVTIDKIFTATKSKAGAPGAAGGAGAPAKDVSIIASNLVLRIDKDGNVAAGHAPFTFKVEKKNTAAAATYSLFPGHAFPYSTTATATNEVATITAQRMWEMISENGAIRTDTGYTQTVIVSCDGLTDQATVVMIRDGIKGDKGDPGGKGDPGSKGDTGAKGRDALVFTQDANPTTQVVGDTWYRPSYKDWYRWDGGSWVRLLGNVASFDRVGASEISVTSLGAISANIGALTSLNANGGRVERDGNGARLYDANNVLRMRWGFW